MSATLLRWRGVLTASRQRFSFAPLAFVLSGTISVQTLTLFWLRAGAHRSGNLRVVSETGDESYAEQSAKKARMRFEQLQQ